MFVECAQAPLGSRFQDLWCGTSGNLMDEIKVKVMPIELTEKQMNVNYIFTALDAPLSGVIVFILACCL